MSTTDIERIFSNDDPKLLTLLKEEAQRVRLQYFGRAISLYAPLYLGNYCENNCVYCGYSSHHKIKRTRLTETEMHQEMECLSQQGIQNILLLTGESERQTPTSYIQQAVMIAKDYFPNIAIEVQPLSVHDYRVLYETGVDGVAVYQETYDRAVYDAVHVSGRKKDYEYRYHTPERAAQSGIRHISMGILLGLGDPVADVCALFQHLRWMEKHYPGVEYSLSYPRIIPVDDMLYRPQPISDEFYIKLLCVTRIVFPRVGINLSTRESTSFRDEIFEWGVTRMSAGSSTVVGGYTDLRDGAPQFDIHDERSFADMVAFLKSKQYDPVLTEWRHIVNGELSPIPT